MVAAVSLVSIVVMQLLPDVDSEVVATIAAAVTLVCNLIPLVRLTRPLSLHAFATNDVAPRTSGRHLLIAAQVAVAVTLLGVSVLLVHSLTRLEYGDRGYTADSVMTPVNRVLSALFLLASFGTVGVRLLRAPNGTRSEAAPV